MLWESSKMEQRYDAVLGVLRDGFSVTEVAQKFCVSRQAVHLWLKRYEEGGLEALAEQSHRPRVSPNQMPAVLEARVLELRRHHPSWGQMHIRHQLEREHVEPVPSLSAIYRALVRSGLIEERAKRKKLALLPNVWVRLRQLRELDLPFGVETVMMVRCHEPPPTGRPRAKRTTKLLVET